MKTLQPSCIIFITLSLFILPLLVSGECVDLCTKDTTGHNKNEALKLKFAAIAGILAAGAVGVSIPTIGKSVPALEPEKDIFFLIKAFAAGIILATGFIHILPSAFGSLTSPCLKQNPWGKFPFAGFVAMVSAIGTLMVDAFASSYYKRSLFNKAKPVEEGDGDEERVEVDAHSHTHPSHGHAHGAAIVPNNSSESDLVRRRVISHVLELGIVVHSVIIGLSLGTSESPSTIRTLLAALSFHQFFEGMGLGGCITQAKFKARVVTIMSIFFSLTTPIGIGLGIGISSIYNENSPTALIVEGTLNSASAGILIYMALVDLLATDFMSSKMQNNVKLQFWANMSLLLGAGFMSLVAKWN